MRGTTPTHTFVIPFDTSMVAKAKVSYKYGGTVLFKKNTADCTMDGNKISVTLTREDTIKFPDNVRIKVQLEVETTAGESLVSKVFERYSGELLDEGGLL